MTALHRAARLLGLVPSRHGCRRRTPLAVWPLADFEGCRPADLIPYASDSRAHPYAERTAR